MPAGTGAPLVLLAAGGTGGHLFPAEALAAALSPRGIAVELVTDKRVAHYGGTFPARAIHLVASETVRGRDPISLARTAAMLGYGTIQAWRLLGKVRPAAVVGFGGYPSVPPIVAASWRRVPSLIHEQNAVLGRANRFLARRVSAIATGFPGVFAQMPEIAAKATVTGNPVRPTVVAAVAPYQPPAATGDVRLLVFGGSQGARIMADIVPPAIAQMAPELRARLLVVQQTREEDIARVTAAYNKMQVRAEIAPFFADLPARMAACHLVVSRSGASTVAELGVQGRPAILVPLPHALDQDQHANAGVLQDAGGAIRLPQREFTPERLATEITALAETPQRLANMATGAKSVGVPDAAERLAGLVAKVAGIA